MLGIDQGLANPATILLWMVAFWQNLEQGFSENMVAHMAWFRIPNKQVLLA